MKIFLTLTCIVLVTLDMISCHIFHRDSMSEDDVSYGLPTLRVRRDTWGSEGRLGGPLYTHVKTSSGGAFKWGAKHMVGQMFAGDKQFNDEFGFDEK